MIELFKIKFQISETAHQSHVSFLVNVPEGVESIQISFQYNPIEEKQLVANQHAVLREGYEKDIVDEKTILRNLLTLSVRDPYAYRGNHHYFSSDQLINLSKEESSLGFLSGAIQPGVWEFIVNCHACISPEIECLLIIQAVTSKNKGMRVKPLAAVKNEKPRMERVTLTNPNAQFKKSELHTHTVHSDASQTLEELISAAEQEGIECLSITDHNTISAYVELSKSEMLNKKIPVILPGIEYTTYHGHFLVHNESANYVENWTEIEKLTIQQFLHDVQSNNSFVTIAHPFDMGNPFCTGCQWEYVLEHLNYVDAIEVWNGTNPYLFLSNIDAYAKWVSLLQEGHEIAASCGRDWHTETSAQEEVAYLYIKADENNRASILKSLKQGRSFISTGPVIDLKVYEKYTIGDRVAVVDGRVELTIHIDNLTGNEAIILYAGKNTIHTDLVNSGTYKLRLILEEFEADFLRLEVKNGENDIIAFTNPIYFS